MRTKTRPALPRASDVLSRTVDLERELKDVLHEQVIRQHRLTVKWLASATGYTENTVYHQLDRDAVNGLSERLVQAAALGDPDGCGAAIREVLARSWSCRWTAALSSAPTAEDLRQLVTRALLAASGAAHQALDDLQDGLVSAAELAATLPMVREAERELATLGASLEQQAMTVPLRRVGP